jgi:polyhydroxybutyrate depolymerase
MSSSSAVETSLEKRSLDVGGRTRTFEVVKGAATSGKPAVLLIFHGSNQSGRRFRASTNESFDELTSDGAALVVYLDGYKAHWNDARVTIDFAARKEGVDDVAFTRAVIDDLVAADGADRERVYAFGYSNGGQLVLRLAIEAPELLAGMALVGASQPVDGNLVVEHPRSKRLPAVLIHGTKDPLVPYAGGVASLWGFRPRGEVMSAPASARYLADRNGIMTPPAATRISDDVDVAEYRADGTPPVVLYTIRGGGHTVPGRKSFPRIMGRTSHSFDTATVVAEFFGLAARSEPGGNEQ